MTQTTATMARPKAPFYRGRTSWYYRGCAENAYLLGFLGLTITEILISK